MATLSMSQSFSAGGVGAAGVLTRVCPSQIGHDPTLQAGQAGTVTTRTDNDTAVITLDDSAVPTVTTSDTVSVFWGVGPTNYRYNMTVTAVGATTISVDAGTGTNLPVLTTAVVVAKEHTVDTDLDADLIELWALSCSNQLHFRFLDDTGTAAVLLAGRLAAGEVVGWASDGIFTNPMAGGDINRVIMSNGGTTAVQPSLCIGYASA
jgi:hypothetical protein